VTSESFDSLFSDWDWNREMQPGDPLLSWYPQINCCLAFNISRARVLPSKNTDMLFVTHFVLKFHINTHTHTHTHTQTDLSNLGSSSWKRILLWPSAEQRWTCLDKYVYAVAYLPVLTAFVSMLQPVSKIMSILLKILFQKTLREWCYSSKGLFESCYS
jgi:hypothetical protein